MDNSQAFPVVVNTIQYYILELPLHTHEIGTLHTARQELPPMHKIVMEEIWYRYDENGEVPYVRVLIRVGGTS